MKRRFFLSAILAGAAAPAVVRADSLMKLWVPPDPYEIISIEYANALTRSMRETKRSVAGSIYANAFGDAPLKREGVLIYYDRKPIALL